MSCPQVNSTSRPDSASPEAWYGPGRCGSLRGYSEAFGNRTGAQRWRDGLDDELVERPGRRPRLRATKGNRIRVRGDAVLPEWSLSPGKTVAAFCGEAAACPIPEWVRQGGDAARKLWLSGQRVLTLDRTFQQSPRVPGPTTAAYFRQLEERHGEEIRALGFSPKRTALLRLRERDEKGVCYDDRIFKSGRKAKVYDERLIRKVKEVHLHPNKFYGSDARDEQERLAAKLGVEPIPYWKVCEIIAEIPRATSALKRHGEAVFKAKFLPKVTVDYGEVPAGDWICLDGRVMDNLVTRTLPGGEKKLVRLSVCAISDMRTPYMELVVSPTENSNAILRGLREWSWRHGLPRKITTDWGKAYMRALLQMIDDLGGAMGIEHVQPKPREPWAKPIESRFRWLKKFNDRLYGGFWGGTPDERSHLAKERAARKDYDFFPSEEMYVSNLQAALETVNSWPRERLNNHSARTMFEQNRGEVRRQSWDALDLAFRPKDGPFKVGQNGLRYKNVLYELDAEDLVQCQGRELYVRPDIDLVGSIAICDAKGRVLGEGIQERLMRAGVRDEDYRRAMAKKARFRKRAKEYAEGIVDFLAETTTTQLLQERREFARAKEAEAKRGLPAPQPEVTIANPQLEEAAQRIGKQRSRRRIAAVAKGAGRTEAPRVNGFERLAARQDDTQRIVPTVCSWEDQGSVPSEHDPEQDATDVFERLSSAS